MKKITHVQVLVAAGAALLMVATPSMAMDKEHGDGPGGMMGSERGMKHEQGDWKNEEKSLGLTEDQRAKMKIIREEAKAGQEALRTELKAKHEFLRKELDAASPDRGKAEGLVKEISGLEEKMGLGRVDMIFKIRQVLTAEQYQKLQAFHEKKRAEMKEHHAQMKKPEGKKE